MFLIGAQDEEINECWWPGGDNIEQFEKATRERAEIGIREGGGGAVTDASDCEIILESKNVVMFLFVIANSSKGSRDVRLDPRGFVNSLEAM